MDQKFDVPPQAEIRLTGQRVERGPVKNDWGLRLQWEVRHNGKVVATPPARADVAYEHAASEAGTYEIVLQTWQYIDYKKKPDGEFINSKFIDISNKVSYSI
ncbi:hypothetical protein ETAA8_60320 [Anatilimnocola aggregata]|uniref:Uncharacterized protein n=1 Tax=Anatilimnocola aggregata TaxID=2528021 RepID=A0A517YKZ5_9BACT|nr:hypothetical protein [Anatilimnocola aggregata]QDU30883.1 hypothetical protein ETAA8_60320 [Anatilimnocola aggregata]